MYPKDLMYLLMRRITSYAPPATLPLCRHIALPAKGLAIFRRKVAIDFRAGSATNKRGAGLLLWRHHE